MHVLIAVDFERMLHFCGIFDIPISCSCLFLLFFFFFFFLYAEEVTECLFQLFFFLNAEEVA